MFMLCSEPFAWNMAQIGCFKIRHRRQIAKNAKFLSRKRKENVTKTSQKRKTVFLRFLGSIAER